MTIRIVIADDQRLLRAGFRVLLTSDPDLSVAGEARTGAEAVDLARRLQPDVVIMDIRMPVMDGIEATRRIRALEGGRDVKIAAVTASGYVSRWSDVLAAGLDDYVAKPYRPDEIFE